MKSILRVMGILTLLSASAFAIEDHGPNMLGWYFDTEATYRTATAFPGVPQGVYLVLTNPTIGEITGWEACYSIEGTALQLGSAVYHAGVNALDGRSFAVSYATPLPCDGPTVLASITLMAVDSTEQHCITLYGLENPTIPGELPVIHLADGSSMQVEVCAFEDSDASAWFGAIYGCPPEDPCPTPCDGITAQSAISWSTLKGLFD